MALHTDEATPHVHVRRVWIAEDDDGNRFVSQTQALRQMGQPKPEEDMPEGRRNNEKYMFTQTDSRLFREICIENGLDISNDLPVRRRQLTKEEYIKQQMFLELGERVQEETHIYDNGISFNAKEDKSDKEFITEVNEALDNNEELSMQTIIEFEIRRQREDAKRRGHLSEYHKDMIEYLSKVKASHTDIDKAEDFQSEGNKIEQIENKDEFF